MMANCVVFFIIYYDILQEMDSMLSDHVMALHAGQSRSVKIINLSDLKG